MKIELEGNGHGVWVKNWEAVFEDRLKWHGPYYRWTGFIGGKQTSRTLSKEEAEQCQTWIENYRKLQEKIAELLKTSLENAPWETREQR